MNNNRNQIKWQPFSAIIPSGDLIQEVLNDKRKKRMPILSEDQKQELQEKMLEFYNNKENITIKFFHDGYFYEIKGKITHIDSFKHKIVINNSLSIYFSQIIDFL